MDSPKKSYAMGLYEKAMPPWLTWREKLEAAKEAGFDSVEISIDETEDKLARLDMPQGERLKLIEAMFETGVPVRSMCLSGHRKFPMGSRDEATAARSMEIMEKALKLADDLGIRIIQLAGYDVYYDEGNEETRRRFEENLACAASMAAQKGIVLAFETMETAFMDTVEKAMGYVSGIGSPYLQVYPDAGNITNAAALYGGDPLTDLETGRGHLAALHLKETVPGKFREIPYGTGHVDFTALAGKAWDLGVRFYVSEFWYTGSPEWKKDLEEACRMLSGVLDRIQAEKKEEASC